MVDKDKVLAHLDALEDDAAAHIWPDDLVRCQTSECVVQVTSVRMGSPDGNTVPLFSREQVVAALEDSKPEAQGGQVPDRWVNVESAMADPLFQRARAIMGTENWFQDNALRNVINHVLTTLASKPPAGEQKPAFVYNGEQYRDLESMLEGYDHGTAFFTTPQALDLAATPATLAQPERVALTPLTDEQRVDLAKAMADRLMGWRLPADFNPDCGISFKRESDYEHPEFGHTTYFPTGTNLFTHEQAVSMLLAILPPDSGTQAMEVTPEAVAFWLEANGYKVTARRIKRKYRLEQTE